MRGTEPVVIKLSDLVDGQEAVCYAALARKTTGMTKRNEPFVKCYFRDRRVTVEAPLWKDHRYFSESENWEEGTAYRLQVRGKFDVRYGMQVDLLGIRPATDADDGFDAGDVYESSRFPADDRMRKIRDLIERGIEQAPLRRLVEDILDRHAELFMKMPAASRMHHAYTGGLIEHVWSMTRIAYLLSDHYAKYYDDLNPPFDRGLVIAATILHDVGKIRELAYNPVEAKYTTEGQLIGHILIGRDMVREAAARIEGFPPETLMLLEHAILAHHGRLEFGSPVLPQTMEALLVSFIDDLDAKMNCAARARSSSQTTTDGFTDRVFGLDNRRFYKGIPVDGPATPEADC